MTINNPIALAFAAVIPVIIALYLLRLKRKKKVISSTFFWTEMVQDLQANVPFQKLRWNILLLLQILIAIAVLLAMADFAVKAQLNEGQLTIFVIDTSASMSASHGGTSRFSSAIGDLKAYSRRLSDREQVMIIDAGEYARVALEFTDRVMEIERTLDNLYTQDTRSDLSTAFSLAVSKAAEVDQPKIVIVSDFTGIDTGIFTDSSVPITFLQPGRAGQNIAITDFMITGLSESTENPGFHAFLAARNFTDQTVHCDVEFYVGDLLVDVRSMEIDPGSRTGRVYSDIPLAEGVVRVELDIEDDLDIDNVAWGMPPTDDSMDVLVAGDNQFLLLALSGIPGIQLYRISQAEYVPGADYDLTFFTGWAPEVLPSGNYVFFNPPPRDYLPCEISDTVSNPVVIDWDEGHPILRFVNPGSFRVFTASTIEPVAGAVSLIEADSTPLMVYGERNYLRSLVFPFELTGSDLIMVPTFPILMYNIVSFFRTYSESGSSGLRTQGIEAVRVDALAEKVRLTGPDGIELEFPIDSGHAFIDVNRAGVYTMEEISGTDSDPTMIVANFFDEGESDIAIHEDVSDVTGDGNIMRFEIEGEKHLWKWLSVLALFILCGEWYFYHRKGF